MPSGFFHVQRFFCLSPFAEVDVLLLALFDECCTWPGIGILAHVAFDGLFPFWFRASSYMSIGPIVTMLALSERWTGAET